MYRTEVGADKMNEFVVKKRLTKPTNKILENAKMSKWEKKKYLHVKLKAFFRVEYDTPKFYLKISQM